MLKVDRIDQSRTRTYHFPTIDFKFQNTGTGAAFLWKFVIEIQHAEIDITPVLSFDMQVENRVLQVLATNNGWGTAHDCQVRMSENILNQLYADSMLRYTGAIQSGEKKTILSFQPGFAHREKFTAISKELFGIRKGRWYQDELREFTEISEKLENIERFVERFGSTEPIETMHGIRLDYPNIIWKYKDNKNTQKTGNTRLFHNHIRHFFLTEEEGFYMLDDFRPAGHFESDTTYSAIIDPSKGRHERVYGISRKVPSGDVERFHIMVGAPMSCHLSIRFKFFIDQTTTIESEVLDIKIWNPRNSQWHFQYKDGEAMGRVRYEDDQRRGRKVQQSVKDDIYDLDQLFTHYEEALAASEAEQIWKQGLALHDLGDYDAALIAYSQVIQLQPKNANTYFCKGVVLYIMKHHSEAIHAYENAVQLGLNANNVPIHEPSLYEQVLAAELAIHRNPDDADAYASKGYALFRLQQHEEALVAYEQAIHRNPDDAHIYSCKGDVLCSLQRYEEALIAYEIAYEQAIRIKPNHAGFYRNKKIYPLRRLGKLEEAQLVEAQSAYEKARPPETIER